MTIGTRVRISVYKPTGWEDTWLVETEDRGLAIREVMSRYDKKHEMSCVNTVEATLWDYNDQLTLAFRIPKDEIRET